MFTSGWKDDVLSGAGVVVMFASCGIVTLVVGDVAVFCGRVTFGVEVEATVVTGDKDLVFTGGGVTLGNLIVGRCGKVGKVKV